MKIQVIISAVFFFWICSFKEQSLPAGAQQFVVITGVAQDAGYPQAGCTKDCCAAYYNGKAEKRNVVSLAFIDQQTQTYFLVEATPDLNEQLQLIQPYLSKKVQQPGAIFLTHAHIGHYTGLMYLGREAMNTSNVPVYTLPRFNHFLQNNGPWSQLVTLQNIALHPIQPDSLVRLSDNVAVTALQVPHRDEFSETAGFIIQTKRKKLLFIPDIDKWSKWNRNIIELVQSVDYALIDATFYKEGELPNRNMQDIPHPFVEESMRLFRDLDPVQKKKIVFIHFNHTNPLLQKNSPAQSEVKQAGFSVAAQGQRIDM